MQFFDYYIPMTSKKNVGREEMFNLYELIKHIEADPIIPSFKEQLIIPYYLDKRGRYELYQYEFCIEKTETFEEHVLRITGKKRIEDVPDNIVKMRRICFAKLDEQNQMCVLNRIMDYFHFLINNADIQSEIINIFGSFNPHHLYICFY